MSITMRSVNISERMLPFAKNVAAAVLLLGIAAMGGTAMAEDGNKTMKIRFVIGKEVINGTLLDNAAARDFASRLPLELKLEDYAGAEKISMLSQKLTLKNAPAGARATAGDITYYAPWGNLAIFYKDHGYASGLIPLGRLDSVESLVEHCKQSCDVRIEFVE